MKNSTLRNISLLLLTGFFFSQCEVQRFGCTDPRADNYDVAADIDDNTCTYNGAVNIDDCDQDLAGNLAVTNQTASVLYLYKNEVFIKCIPPNTEGFVINIPNQEFGICKLQIWKAEVIADKEKPDLTDVYRQWSVALSNTTELSERASWLITDDENYAGSGTLLLSYPNKDEFGQNVLYQVDVFINSKTGARLASLQPGVKDKKVSIDYGLHYVYFRYWYSDPNSSSGEITEIGWNEKSEIVINAQHISTSIDIPVFISNIGKYGEIEIENTTTHAINIYSNEKLIEDIAKVEGSSLGLSTIPAGKSTSFVIPVNKYSFTAKSLSAEVISDYSNINVIEGEVVHLKFGNTTKIISLTNNTDQTLAIFTESEQYLGLVLKPGETSSKFKVSSDLDSLLAINLTKTSSKKIPASSFTIKDLEDHKINALNILSPWEVISPNVYQSPKIENKQSTSMTAALEISETTTLSFDYKVSSEVNYDLFKFYINGTLTFPGVSGEIDWTPFSIQLEPGTHSIEWLYSKDDMFSVGTDNVQIRNILFE